MGVQNRSKPVTEVLPRRKWIRSAFWNGFGASEGVILKVFLQSPCDRMMCKNEKHDKARIFKNTSVFTVRLNIDVAEDSRRLSVKSINFELGSWKPSQSPSEPTWDLDLEVFWAGKTF